jgi:glycosyltransferase involved in cell wall biosynthesis
MEAMAAGVPIVATEVGGMAEVVRAGGTGLLVPAGDASALSSSLLELVSDPSRRAAMGEAAARRAGEFTAERQAERCAALYEELLAARTAR